ncbi:MAG: Asp-tRNA(Asn)/Glu-tRNA(Gln) amidotransferase subunit GatC [Alphaproteobacteria bacterium]
MKIDVKKVANLARIAVPEERLETLGQELEAIVGFVEQLSEVNTDGVEPMTSVVAMTQRLREDIVTDGDKAEQILANAPDRVSDFFAVPKVVE